MSAFSTSCPNCGAAFVVTPQQLAVANGSVRCGSCMHIFVAAAHRTDPKPGSADSSIFDFKLDTSEAKPTPAKPGKTESRDGLEFSDQFLNLNAEQKLFTDAEDDESQPGDDEQWAKNLLADIEDDEPAPRSPAKPAQKAKADSDDLDSILSPEFNELSQLEPAKPRTAAAAEAPAEQPDESIASVSAEPDHERRRMLSSIQADPLEFTFRRFHWSVVLSRAVYFIAAATLLLALGAQYAWFNMAELARNNDYRPWYELACAKLQCTVPARDDVSLIQASNLVVRSHPSIANALIVDALLTNRATFDQAYPDLELVFTDTQGKVVAARRLHPAEYHAPANDVMMSGTPFHLALEIVDPGPTATGYRILIHRPTKA